jgi:CRP-like cAMP-binding protein
MDRSQRILVAKLKEHSRLTSEDIAEICTLSHGVRALAPNEDFIRQGDKPKVAALVLSGMVARYHLLTSGRRQYLSFNMAGDLPDSQGLFIERMDHAICAVGPAVLATIPHSDLVRSFDRRPEFAFAIWRETLIDAAIFREAISNLGSRPVIPRMAHLFCELFYRARASRLTTGDSFVLPISLTQLGETLGMSIATVNRALLALRKTKAMDFRNGLLSVYDWTTLIALGDFDPLYLHLKRAPRWDD